MSASLPAARATRSRQRVLFALALGVVSLSVGSVWAATRSVGPGKTYAKPCAAIAAAQPGDVIEIDASGNYDGDVCGWSKANITLRGVGGRPKIDAAGQNAQGKGTWVVGGNDAVIENVEMSGAAVPDLNGAALRLEGQNVTLRNVYLHDNQEGILGGAGEVLIEHSTLARNGNCLDPSGCAHNVYLGPEVTKFTMRFSESYGASSGHEVKSRAKSNYLLYNRIADENGTASYTIDLPNGGTTVLLGNLIHQGPNTENTTIVSYGAEGLSNPGKDLYVVHNTFVNGLGRGNFVDVAGGALPAVITNNVFMGGGNAVNQPSAIRTGNFTGDAKLVDVASFDYRLLPASPCVDQGVVASATSGGFSLVPTFHFGGVSRVAVGAPDIGAFELGAGSGEPVPPDLADSGVPPGEGSSDDAGSASEGGVSGVDGGVASEPGSAPPPPAPAPAGPVMGLSCALAVSKRGANDALACGLLVGLAFALRTRRR